MASPKVPAVAALATRLRRHFGWEGPAAGGNGPALIICAGLPGTGKSYLASAIAARHPVALVRSDEIRKAIFERPEYTGAESGVVYLTCYSLLGQLLEDGYVVVFDATNLVRRGRRRARAIARLAGAPTLTVLTVAPPELVAARLARRTVGGIEAYSSDADWAVHQKLAPTLQGFGANEASLVVDTSQPLDTALEVIDQFLAGHSALPNPTTSAGAGQAPVRSSKEEANTGAPGAL